MERMWTEAVMTYFKILSRNLHIETKETQEKPQNSRRPRRDSIWNLPDANTTAVRSRQTRSEDYLTS
jgi:hypothetical protein